jgi:hypothetical protein
LSNAQKKTGLETKWVERGLIEEVARRIKPTFKGKEGRHARVPTLFIY